jgi:hypothetical protein
VLGLHLGLATSLVAVVDCEIGSSVQSNGKAHFTESSDINGVISRLARVLITGLARHSPNTNAFINDCHIVNYLPMPFCPYHNITSAFPDRATAPEPVGRLQSINPRQRL